MKTAISTIHDYCLRGALASLGVIISYYIGNITPLFYLMIGFAAVDYIMGMAAAKWYPATQDDGWCSKKAKQGFIKKIAYILLVGVAWGVDFLILEIDRAINLPLTWGPYFGVFAMCYLILTEGVSILENAAKMDIHIPFLTSALKSFRAKISGPHDPPDKKE